MSDTQQIRAVIEQAVSQRFTEHVERLRREIVEQVLREVEPFLSRSSSESSTGHSSIQQTSASSGVLSAAIASIQESSVQADILKALLEGVAHFSARAALFVVRGTTLAGWQARGFTDENFRGLSLDGSKGLAARAIQDRGRASAAAVEFDAGFAAQHGKPWDGNATIFPLVVKDKVAAILYCDSGNESGHQNDYSAVEVLARYACLWLEHAASRKSAVAEPGSVAPHVTSPPAASFQSPVVAASPAVAPESALENVPGDEQEVHKKAKRFAKLLVDEIKLYNQSKVAEGKQNRDLYNALREDIEKSRATYEKRYGSTPAASAKYFDSEVVRILADNDRSLLGSDFPG